MSRSLVIALVALVVVIGLLVVFSKKNSERAPTRVEKSVSLANLT